MNVHQSTRCRRRPQRYLPIILEEDECEPAETVVMQAARSPKHLPNHREVIDDRRTFTRETMESFLEIYSLVRLEMREHRSLYRSFAVYLILMQLHVTVTSAKLSHWQLFLNFVRYYPFILGWTYIVSKCNSILANDHRLAKSKLTRGHSSSETCDTVSSIMSEEISEDEQTIDPGTSCTQQLTNLHSLSRQSQSLPNVNANHVMTQGFPQLESKDRPKDAIIPSSVSLPLLQLSLTGEEDKIQYPSEEKPLILRSEACPSAEETENEWGYFADFADEGPKIPEPIVVKKCPTLSTADYYQKIVRIIRTFTQE